MRKITKSLEWLARAERVIPTQSQTFSKSPNYFPKGTSPVYIRKASGSYVWDSDSNGYIDFIMGLGPITLGYNYSEVDRAIMMQLKDGIIFSLPSPLEVELAELIVEVIPSAEMVRFLKTGSEACQAAIRIARAYTKRDKMVSWGYHGWHSEFSIATERKEGIPAVFNDYIIQFDYNDLDGLENIFKNNPFSIACVIMEPVIGIHPEPGFLEGVKSICEKYGSLLVWDEVVTGFRWSLGGASEYFSIDPDIVILGKGMANGLPLSCVCGKRDIMMKFEDVMVSSTHGGECLSLAAGLATIKEIRDKDTIEHNWFLGSLLRKGLKRIGMGTIGYDCRPCLVMPDDQVWKSKLLEQLLLRGILIHITGLINICYSHSVEDINQTLNAFEDTLKIIDNVELQGKVVHPAFRRV